MLQTQAGVESPVLYLPQAQVWEADGWGQGGTAGFPFTHVRIIHQISSEIQVW